MRAGADLERIGTAHFFDEPANGLPLILGIKQLGLNDLLKSQAGQVASQKPPKTSSDPGRGDCLLVQGFGHSENCCGQP
jgi:hypothetical protein